MKRNEELPSMTGGARGGSDDIASVIMNGITFKAGSKGGKKKEDPKVKTKATRKRLGKDEGRHPPKASKPTQIKPLRYP